MDKINKSLFYETWINITRNKANTVVKSGGGEGGRKKLYVYAIRILLM